MICDLRAVTENEQVAHRFRVARNEGPSPGPRIQQHQQPNYSIARFIERSLAFAPFDGRAELFRLR
jgi:hypothetical protein